MTEKQVIIPPSEYIERFDQSKWRVFYIPTGIVVITSSGQELFKNNPRALLELFHQYREDVINNTSKTRVYFKSGGNSDVYIGDKEIVVKEIIKGTSGWSSLDRMDKLYWLCLNFLHPLARVPKHYALISSRRLAREYLVMQKANEGITAEEIEEIPDYKRYIPTINMAIESVRRAIQRLTRIHFPSENLLPDYHKGNIIVDFSTPVKVIPPFVKLPINELPFTLWIIDQ